MEKSKYHLHINRLANFIQELKGRPIIFIMRSATSLTGCYA